MGQPDQRRMPRKLAFVIMLVLIVGPPFAGQVLGIHSPLIRRWMMFSGKGLGVVTGQMVRVTGDGSVEEPFDRYAYFTPEESKSGSKVYPHWLWKTNNAKAFKKMVQQTCYAAKRAEGKTPHLRVYARKVTRKGWVDVNWGRDDACREVHRKPGKQKRRARPKAKRGAAP